VAPHVAGRRVAVYTWNANTTGPAVDGSGTWSTGGATNWWNGGNSAWSDGNDAWFGAAHRSEEDNKNIAKSRRFRFIVTSLAP